MTGGRTAKKKVATKKAKRKKKRKDGYSVAQQDQILSSLTARVQSNNRRYVPEQKLP